MNNHRSDRTLEGARVAIVHEWMTVYGGSEQVVAAMLEEFPGADVFTLVRDEEGMSGTPLGGVRATTSFLQSLPKSRTKYRTYLPLMPLAVEQFDLRDYEIVISSNHAVAKGILTRSDQLHISYVHTPVRYAWDLYLDYLEEGGLDRGPKSWLARGILHYIRLWDVQSANRVDVFLANSAYVSRRINKLYRREAKVLHPPVEVGRYRPDVDREDFYVAVSRFVPYKRMRLIVEAFTTLGLPLVVIGAGPEFERARAVAGSNVRLIGYKPDEVVTDHLQRAKAFVFAANEDFGITPVEAQAAGCPVIAYGSGGVLETVIGLPDEDATGVFFNEQTPRSLIEAVRTFEENAPAFRPETCRSNAERFAKEKFRAGLRSLVDEAWGNFTAGERSR